MITITKEQAQNRFTLLPPTLQDAMFSEQTTEVISSLGEQYHLPAEKVEDIASLVGWVLLGFLHLEDLPSEMVADTGIAAQLAKDITDSLTSKIFTLVKSDIDKTYAPVPHERAPEEPIVIPSVALPQGKPPVALSQQSQSAIIPKPTTLSDIGWSKQSAPQPTPNTKIQGVSSPVPALIRPQSPTPATKPTEPAPMILHEDTTFKPAEKNAGFILSKPGSSAEMNISQTKTQAPIRPAVIEFGATPPPPKPQSAGPQATHYTDFKPSLATMSTASGGPRNVSQITPATLSSVKPTPSMSVPIPRPPMAPKPPTPPTPASAITPQPNKPIVKDFL